MLQPVPRLPAHVPNPDAWREMLTTHLPLIRRVVRGVCRHYGESREHEEELFSDVCVKLLEQDCAALQQFRGECTLPTYLRIVAVRVLLDRRVRAWGKWRPTSRARALGANAIALERLIARDGLRPDEAVAVLTTGSPVDYQEAMRLSMTIRPRRRAPMIALDRMVDVPERRETISPSAVAELRQHAASLRRALVQAMRSLAAADVDLLRWRYCDGRSVAEIARATGLDQKRLYRRYDQVLDRLRLALERSDVHAAEVRDLVGHAVVDISGVLRSAASTVLGQSGRLAS